MAERIVSRSLSKQGLENWDKIFGKKKKVKKEDQQVESKQEVEFKKCDLCGTESVFYGHIC